MSTSGESDAQLATRLAVDAGIALVALRDELFAAGAPPWQVMDTGDLRAHQLLLAELNRVRPNDAVLSEEGTDDLSRVDADRVWIIDPLDGTSEYGEQGRSDWAVHIALWEHGALSAGAVSLPALGRVHSTDPAPALPAARAGRVRLVSSRRRTTRIVGRVAEALDGEVVPLGSAGAKAMAVVTGEADAYVHAGGMYQWDSAAPAAVAAAAGLHVSRIDGSPMVYNEPDPWLPDFVVCRPELAEPIMRAVWADLPPEQRRLR